MESAIFDYLIHNWPNFVIIIIVAVAAFKVSRKFTKWEYKHSGRHDELEKNQEKYDKSMDNIQNRLVTMEQDIISIKSVLMMKYKNAADVFSIKKSPRRLNENGERIFADIHGKDFLENNKHFLFSKIDELNPKTALDVENAANFVCTANIDNAIFNGMKNFVYNSPTYLLKDNDGKERQYDIALSDICFVLSLPLRDMYLIEHPEILDE